ncbi:MAG: helix-turn-helix domain-containing protein [Deltaproteobacteria bacterium]|nr:helix-turn-helix domain-containing protein [Deltaproteobacteria bacterium]
MNDYEHPAPSKKTLPALLTAHDVAELIGVNPSRVYQLHRRGEIPGGARIGKRLIRFDRDVVIAWLTERDKRKT